MQISLPKDITKNLQNTKSFFDVNDVNIDAAVNAVNQTAQQANQVTENAKVNLREAANTTLDNVTEKSGQLFNSINTATSTLKNSLETSIGKFDGLNQTLSDGIQASINSSLNSWIDKNPQLVWLINNPLQCFVILLLGIFIFSGLLAAISKITERFWLAILTYPFKIFSNTWKLVSKSLQKDDDKQKIDNLERVAAILSRLELIRQEQTLLSQELESLLK